MTKDLIALDGLINKAIAASKKLDDQSKALAEKDKQYAEFLKTVQVVKEEESILWSMVREHMIENNIMEHETQYVQLKLCSSGKYKLNDGVGIDEIPDEFCEVKRILSNKKIKAAVTLSGRTPDGISSTGYVLRRKIKEIN